MPARLDHLTVAASDFAAAVAFYDAALAPLGLTRLHELGDEEEDDAASEVAAFGPAEGTAVLWVTSGQATVTTCPHTTCLHIAWRADDRVAVDEFFAAAVAAGGTARDAPRRWAVYRRGEYNAIVADPDGNLVEAIGPE